MWHANGTMKCIFPDLEEVIYFNNGDSKTVSPDGKVAYWYNEPRTMHTTLLDGMQIYQFDNGQVERVYTNGTYEITFADLTVKYILPNGGVPRV